MIKKTIEHPLRTINLEFDESKVEIPQQKELLEDYIKLHDDLYAVDRKGSKLIYDYKEAEEDLIVLENTFAAIEVKIKQFLEELQQAKKSKDVSILSNESFNYRIEVYDKEIKDFHLELYLPISQKVDAIEEDYKAFNLDSEIFIQDYDEYGLGPHTKFNANYNDYSMEFCSYDDDQQAFAEASDKLTEYEDYKNDFVEKYNVVADHINEVYIIAANIQTLIHEIRDEEGLLDSSLSDSYQNGTGDLSKKPIYFMECADETVKTFVHEYGVLAASNVKTVVISVDKGVIDQGNNTMICELLSGLQHYPKLIEKMIFAIRIDIIDTDGMVLPEEQWKGFAPPMKWYQRLSYLPVALFFFEDHDARAFILMGDLLADDKFVREGDRVKIEGELLQEVRNRLFNACYFFMVYCHNTGFDPTAYIEAILADFDFHITYEQVKEKFELDLAVGIHIQLVRKTEEDQEE